MTRQRCIVSVLSMGTLLGLVSGSNAECSSGEICVGDILVANYHATLGYPNMVWLLDVNGTLKRDPLAYPNGPTGGAARVHSVRHVAGVPNAGTPGLGSSMNRARPRPSEPMRCAGAATWRSPHARDCARSQGRAHLRARGSGRCGRGFDPRRQGQ